MPIVANGLIYLSARGAPTEAWSTDGCGSATCPPLWSTTDAPSVPVTPIVINGRLLLAGTGITTYALPWLDIRSPAVPLVRLRARPLGPRLEDAD